MGSDDLSTQATTANKVDTTLSDLITDLPFPGSTLLVVSHQHRLTLDEVRDHVRTLGSILEDAGVTRGTAVGVRVEEGARSLLAMFAVWRAGGVYVPINGRSTPEEVAASVAETPIALIIDSAGSLPAGVHGIGLVQFDESLSATLVTQASQDRERYAPDVALAMRTSGTTGRPKSVLLRHSGTVGALDSSLRKIRRRTDNSIDATGPVRMNLVPTSLSLWAGIYNTVFSFRAGFGVILMDKFDVARFVSYVREFSINSTVLAPAMITMLTDDPAVDDLTPLKFVRSITAPLSPKVAREFYKKFGVFVLNSYGQTELGGEVVGWNSADVREFGVSKLGAAGRAYEDVDIQIRGENGDVLGPAQLGEIHVNSPFRMRGYANNGSGSVEDDRFVDGYLRTGDVGKLDEDGFLWIEGRISDMINRGGLKVFPDEVEEVLRRHPDVRDAAVAAVPDRRLGEVPQAWIVSERPDVVSDLEAWCREHLVPYKIPARFTRVDSFPRNEIGKVLRRELAKSPPS